MNARDWLPRFSAARERAEARAVAARREGRRIACGFTANLDRVVTLDRAAADRLFAGQALGAGPRVRRAGSVGELLTGIAQCLAAGEGGDLPVHDSAVQDWLLARVRGREQIGGTGAQAAATLATLGFPVLLHLTGRSPRQIAALPGQELIALGSAQGLTPLAAGAVAADAAMWHVALEFPAGVRVPLPGHPAAPAANRVIVSYDPINSAFSIDEGFAAALRDPALDIGALLISGFSQVTARETLERVLAETAAALRVWRAVRPGLLVHLELGAMPEADSLARTLQVLHPLLGSVGLNSDELCDLLGACGRPAPVTGPALATALRDLAARYPVPRWSLHSRDACLTLTDGDPEVERDALLFAALLAATRARRGAFPNFGDLDATLARVAVSPAGLALLDALGLAAGGSRDGLVATPGLAIGHARATVGLGDSFTAGLLAMV